MASPAHCYHQLDFCKDSKIQVNAGVVKGGVGGTHHFPAIWVEERRDLGVDPRDGPGLPGDLPSQLLSDEAEDLCALINVLGADSNLGVEKRRGHNVIEWKWARDEEFFCIIRQFLSFREYPASVGLKSVGLCRLITL